jgi:hypothetical protein
MRKPSTASTARKNTSTFSLNPEEDLKRHSITKPVKAVNKNMESGTPVMAKTSKKFVHRASINPVVGNGLTPKMARPMKKSSVIADI